ncbi:ArsR/SmtB family transcription factor [Daeguia caeni]|uniref:ArsR/SmtB family transcription factor n=1 Tax=Daeguia caeni TaxID=439612 RepID=A0ABV9H3M8_9HYPH
MTGNETTLLSQLQALAHPVRLWIISNLADGRRAFVSQLAKEAGISRPLMKMHLLKCPSSGFLGQQAV